MMRCCFLLLLLFCFKESCATGFSYLPINAIEKERYSFTHLNPYILHYACKEHVPIDSLIKNQFSNFQPLMSLALNQGPSDLFHWIVLPLHNDASQQEEVFFTLKNSAINGIRYYWLQDDEVVWQGMSGDHYPFWQRPYPFCNFTFPVQIPSGSKGLLVLELDKRNENFFCGFDLMKAQDFRNFETKTYWVFGIFTGIILITIAVNLFLFFALKDRIHFWYAVYAISNMLLLLSYEGMDFQFLYPGIPFLSNVSRYFTTGVTYILLFQMLVVFVKQGLIPVQQNRLIRGMQILHLTVLISALFTYSFLDDNPFLKILLFRSLSLLGVISLCILMVMSFVEYRKGHKPSLLFFVAISLLLLGSIEYVLNINGLYTGVYLFPTAIPSNMQICLVLEVVVVFFAIFYRYKVYRNEGMQLKYKLLEAEANWRDQQIQSILQERKRIAMDIHDGIGSRLFGARLKLDGIARAQFLEGHPFQDVGNELTSISKELKNIIWSLSKNDQPTQSTLENLRHRVEDILHSAGRETDIIIEVKTEMKPEFLMDFQLMTLEIANNFIKHSEIKKAKMLLLEAGDQLVFEWREIGQVGGQRHSRLKGMGLESIHVRYLKWQGEREALSPLFDYKIEFVINTIQKNNQT